LEENKMILKIKLLVSSGRKESIYTNEVNADDYSQIAQVLKDLKVLHNLPIDKAIKKLSLSKSDWDASLGI